MKSVGSIFNFYSPLHSKQDKTLEPFTSLIPSDWIHSWPQGASSHCSFPCFFCCECTFPIAPLTLSWLTCCWEVPLLFSRRMSLWCLITSTSSPGLFNRAIISIHGCSTRRCTYSSLRVTGGRGGVCLDCVEDLQPFRSVRPHSWVYRSLIIPLAVHTKAVSGLHVPVHLSANTHKYKRGFI